MVPGSLRPYQKDRFVRVIETIAKYIAASPFFIVPKRYRRNADCPSVPHTSDLLVKFLLYSGCGLPWVAQVNNDKVKAPEPSCDCSWFVIQLNQSSRRKLPVLTVAECRRAARKFSSSLELAKLLAFNSTRRELPVDRSSHTPAPCCKQPTTVAAPIIPFMSSRHIIKQKRWALVRATVAL